VEDMASYEVAERRTKEVGREDGVGFVSQVRSR